MEWESFRIFYLSSPNDIGVVLILILSINELVLETQGKFDEIEIFLQDEVTDEQLTLIEDTIGRRRYLIRFI